MAGLVVGLFFFAVLSLEQETSHANLPFLYLETTFPSDPTHTLMHARFSAATITGLLDKTVAPSDVV